MHKIIVNPLLMKKWQEFHIFAQLTDLWWLTDLYGTPGPVLAPKGPFRGPEGLGRPGESRFGPNCRQLVWLGWNYGYQTLWPGIWPLLGPQGPQKGLFWPQKALLGAPEGLGGPGGSSFGPNCHQLVWLGWNHGYQKYPHAEIGKYNFCRTP